ncbi:MAG: hypothetical protein GC150_08045 [Rhizobiales bacterium]|nr:hypothetical protein [Hyphomicrobiales bacterium]
MTSAPSILLTDEPPRIGLRYAVLGALAASIAPAARCVAVVGPPPEESVHARQHVTPVGRREENGILWLERAGVAWRRGDRAQRLEVEGSTRTVSLSTIWIGSQAVLTDEAKRVLAHLDADRHGRLALRAATDAPAWLRNTSRSTPVPGARRTSVTVISNEQRLPSIYGAVHAALGDAADALGIDLEISVAGAIPPDACDGVVLPGGAEMNQVRLLGEAVRVAGERNLPVLGLCLGMQSMVLHALRTVPGLEQAELAETHPDAPLHAFVPIVSGDGRRVARLGDRMVSAHPASRLFAMLQRHGLATEWRERMNHSFQANPKLLGHLETTGISLLSIDVESGSLDLVANESRNFLVGAEGHPELNSTPHRPHPLIMAFLIAASG